MLLQSCRSTGAAKLVVPYSAPATLTGAVLFARPGARSFARDGRDFNQCVSWQPRHLHGRARRRFVFEVGSVDSIHLGEVIHVLEIDGHIDDVFQGFEYSQAQFEPYSSGNIPLPLVPSELLTGLVPPRFG